MTGTRELKHGCLGKEHLLFFLLVFTQIYRRVLQVPPEKYSIYRQGRVPGAGAQDTHPRPHPRVPAFLSLLACLHAKRLTR